MESRPAAETPCVLACLPRLDTETHTYGPVRVKALVPILVRYPGTVGVSDMTTHVTDYYGVIVHTG